MGNMQTRHRLVYENAVKMAGIADGSVDLAVTSPPYPMIEMWDELFSSMNPAIRIALDQFKGGEAFELMHRELDRVWRELARVLKNGGFACINIGDATRSLNGDFMLYPNHARILTALYQEGLSPLPAVIWRKQTNAPNKFMGSGVLPAGAYMTLEHEYILILRKGGKREFADEKAQTLRQESALFWEERNQWFSDVWMDLKGARQDMADKAIRRRSGAFPFELPYRLINMYSVRGDLVLDPFAGTGATLLAAMATGRNSLGFELNPEFARMMDAQAADIQAFANNLIQERLARHEAFVREREQTKGPLKHQNGRYGFPVVMRQERELWFPMITDARKTETGEYVVTYTEQPEKRPAQGLEQADAPAPEAKEAKSAGKVFLQMEFKL